MALVSLGSRNVDHSLMGLLAACHCRIRENLALARRLATEVGHSSDEVRDAALRVQRYFSLALPLHMADEDASIAPRLMSANAVLSVTLDVLAEQHKTYQPLVDWLVSLCSRLEQNPGDLASAQTMLAQTLDLLTSQLETHLELEERVVFPALTRMPAAEQERILVEMRARRETPASVQVAS